MEFLMNPDTFFPRIHILSRKDKVLIPGLMKFTNDFIVIITVFTQTLFVRLNE